MSDLVGNSENRSSRDAAQKKIVIGGALRLQLVMYREGKKISQFVCIEKPISTLAVL